MMPLSEHMAVVVSDSNEIEISTVPTRYPRAGEVMLSPLMVGICGTDLEIIRGTRPDTARILGHEGVAEVVEVGSGVVDFSIGQKVVLNPVNPHSQNDILGHSAEGLFQQSFLVSQSALERGLMIPFETSIPLVCGPLVEPLGTVIYGHSLVDRACRQDCIAIIGAGPIGLMNAIYARSQGCSQIFLIDSQRERLDWAVKREIVAADEIVLSSSKTEDLLLEKTAGRGVDSIYLCTTRSNARDALKQSLRYLRSGGCVDLVVGFSDNDSIHDLPEIELNSIRRSNICGIPQAGAVQQCHSIEGKEVWLTGHRGTSSQHLRDAMRLLRDRPARYASLISHVVSLQSVPLILKELATMRPTLIRGEVCVMIIIDFTVRTEAIEVFDPRSF